ncbi:KAT8 regulatory NSL complex subunit 1-like isoform X2 [Gigantopelta aegis]|uniref:KAT8 regulatory NSL complex subunit 1-like isoform X2 n=1 Tax=Gigantopelta aegis TaxID=1735272 RepID=UPI001B889472|nr:KAT8 regulatory NSL complex subunit 1-like isoform X2 [Gigantopelta aegis]
MSGPLSLRICCMAAMAPALTEAATQVRIKDTLPGTVSPPSVTSASAVLNGRDLNGKRDIPKYTTAKKLSLNIVNLPRSTKQLKHFADHLLKSSPSVKLATQSLSTSLKNLRVAQIGSIVGKEKSHTGFLNGTVHLCTAKSLMNGRYSESMNRSSLQNENKCPGKEDVASEMGKNNLVNGQMSNKNGLDCHGEGTKLTNGNILPSRLNNMCKDSELLKPTSVTDTGVKDGKMSPIPTSCSVQDTAESESKNPRDDCDTPQTEALQQDVIKQQFQLKRRADFLLRRLRRLQGRQLEGHSRNQLRHFVDYQHKHLQTVVKSIQAPVSSDADLKTDLLQSEDVKNMSTSALVSLVRKLQAPKSMSMNPKLLSVHQHANAKTETLIQTTLNVLTMDASVKQESHLISNHISSHVHFVESVLDSDATESSSGGESADDFEDYYKGKKTQHVPIYRRSEWKWSRDRAGIASRWTWLQAQVSDLEYRIRQQSEIYKQIRSTKGSVVLGDTPSPQNLLARLHPVKLGHKASPLDALSANLDNRKNETSPCNISTLLSNVDKQASRLTQSLGNCLSPNSVKSTNSSPGRSLNGIIDSPLGNSAPGGFVDNSDANGGSPVRTVGGGDIRSTLESDTSPLVDTLAQAARCRPIRSFRKRKLLQTSGLYLTNRKAARLSTVKCKCYPPDSQCPMCGGRYNNTQTLDSDTMALHERVSLLDPDFHPVLSFPQDIPLPIYFEALLKTGEWQSKQLPKRTKNEVQKRKYRRIQDPMGKVNRQVRKSAAAVLVSSKIRSKYENKTVRKNSSQKNVSTRRLKTEIKRRAAKLAIAMRKRSDPSISDSFCLSVDDLSPVPSPLSASCPGSSFKEQKDAVLRKRRGETDYDINNIVIPYSIAAATRVEKLQYKEIVTPKWREISPEDSETPSADNAGESTLDLELQENEDLTDEAFLQRHLVCELEEKKRFSVFVQYPARRGRARFDIGGSSINEPASPEPSLVVGDMHQQQQELSSTRPQTPEPLIAGSQAMLTPPAQTSSPHLFSAVMNQGSFFDEYLAFTRRGSVSRRERLSSGSTVEEMESAEPKMKVDPWPSRTFPLSDSEYDVMKAETPPMPERVRTRVRIVSTPARCSTPSSSMPCSPLPSTSSDSVISEDPNDPEWNLSEVVEDDQKKGSVVLRITKR